MTKGHFEHIDLLRTVAIAAVILQHCTDSADYGGGNLVYRSLSRCNILLFIVVSGYLLIPKQIPIRLMWSKYIKRIAITFAVWSFAYSCYNMIVVQDIGIVENAKKFICDFISGGTNRMWYLVMLVGLYSIIPFASLLFTDKTKQYGINLTLLLFMVTILFPTVAMIPSVGTILSLDMERIAAVFPGHLPFYLLLGVALRLWQEDGKLTNSIVGVVGVLFALSVVTLVLFSFFHMAVEQNFVVYVFVVLGIYIYSVNYYPQLPVIIKKIVRNIADCSFGIYLVHTFIQYALRALSFDTLLTNNFYPIFSIPMYTIVLWLLSWLATFLLRLSKVGRKIT